jgi:iron complex outermembrane recepter protein
MTRKGRSARLSAALLFLASGGFHAGAMAAEASSRSLADLSLEELVNIEITSVSRRAERLSDAAASVFVITAEDIRRSGARRLPDVLRLAPNLHVAQGSASGYAISARGLNSSSSNKLLVLIDGRSVYTPLFSGVFWDQQDVMLEDVERIEVISGPAGTLWGVNAVNGVINVITRSAAATQGGLVAAGTGNRDSDASLRYGGKLGEHGSYRVYGKYFEADRTATASGVPKDDAWHKSQIGFRTDWSQAGDTVTINGNAYRGTAGQPLPGSIAVTGLTFPLAGITFSGMNLTGRWSRALEGGSNVAVQGYLDRTERTVPPSFSDTLNIIDLQLQHSLQPTGIHALVWGAEYRYGMDRVSPATFLAFSPPRPFFAFLPEKLNQTWASLFAQDEITLSNDLKLTAGARLEHNDYTGMEVLPSLRVAWKLARDHLLWSAASRTVRAPSRFDRDVFIPASPPFLLAGGSPVRSEVANVYEIGYRGQPTSRTSYSVTAFHSVFHHLRTQEIAPSGTFLVFASEMEGKSNGIETWGSFHATESWRLSAGFSGLRERLQLKPGSTDAAGRIAQEGRDPAQMWMLRSSHNLPYHTELDAMLRHVSALASPTVPAYTVLDVRLGWSPRRDVELSITGQNLLSAGHGEFSDPATRTQLERGVFFKVVGRF